jgi:hypothetical protein
MFTMPCDPHNKYQQFAVSKGRLTIGNGDCLTAVGGSRVIAAKCIDPPQQQQQQQQQFALVANAAGPKGTRQYAVLHNSSNGSGPPSCLQLSNGGAALVPCDPGVSDQGFTKHLLRTTADQFTNRDSTVFNLATTWCVHACVCCEGGRRGTILVMLASPID